MSLSADGPANGLVAIIDNLSRFSAEFRTRTSRGLLHKTGVLGR